MAAYQFRLNLADGVSANVRQMREQFSQLRTAVERTDSVLDQLPTTVNTLRMRMDALAQARDAAFNPRDIARFNREIAQTEGEINRMTGQNSGGGFGGMARSIAGAFAIGGVIEFGRSIVDTTAEFQKYEAVLTNTLGSQTAAKNIMADITKFAAATPFEIGELTEAYVKLKNRGLDPNIEMLSQIGDLAASQGKSFEQVSEAVMDAPVKQFIRLQESLGIDVQTLKGGMLKFTGLGVTKIIKDDPKVIKDTVLELSKLPQVAGSMASISETTGGQISNLSDAFTTLKKEIGTAFLPVIKSSISGLGGMIGAFRSTIKFIQDYSTAFKLAGIAIGSAIVFQKTFALVNNLSLISLKSMTAGLRAMVVTLMANPWAAAIAGIVALGVALYGLSKAFSGVNKEQERINELSKGIIERYGEEKAKIELLFKPLKDHNLSKTEQRKALDALKEAYPELIEMYGSEANLLNNIDEAEQRLLATRLHAAVESAKADEAGRIAKLQINAALAQQELERKMQGDTQGSTSFKMKETLMSQANKMIDEGNQQLSTLDSTFADIERRILGNNAKPFASTKGSPSSGTMASMSSAGGGSGTVSSAIGEATGAKSSIRNLTINIQQANGVHTLQVSNFQEAKEKVGEAMLDVLLTATNNLNHADS